MGLFNTLGGASGVTTGMLGGISEKIQAAQAQKGRPIDLIQQAQTDALRNIQTGLSDATTTLQPGIGRSNQLSAELQNLLMGQTPTNQIPGFDAMTSARREAIGDLGTGMAGTGKFFSGTTAERAGEIGGAMENQLIQQRIQNLIMGAQPGQQAMSQLAGMEMGAGTAGAQIPMQGATNIAQMLMQQEAMREQAEQTKAQNKSNFFGDVLGLAGTIGGALIGSAAGPAGTAAGAAVGGNLMGGG